MIYGGHSFTMANLYQISSWNIFSKSLKQQQFYKTDLELMLTFSSFIVVKIQLFWERHKNLPHPPYGLDIYLVNIQTIRRMTQICVFFSKKLNFNNSNKFGHSAGEPFCGWRWLNEVDGRRSMASINYYKSCPSVDPH